MKKFRDSTLEVRNSVHQAVLQKKSKDEITKCSRTVFHWAAFQARASTA